jgi:hypothetical protein
MMTRFYFHLTSKQDNIPDDSGKELDTLIDAYQHARVLIDKILFHVGYDDTDVWKVVISSDEDDAQMIVHSLFLMLFAANAEGQLDAVATVFNATARNTMRSPLTAAIALQRLRAECVSVCSAI